MSSFSVWLRFQELLVENGRRGEEPEEAAGARGTKYSLYVVCGRYFKKMNSDQFYSKNKSTNTQNHSALFSYFQYRPNKNNEGKLKRWLPV